MNIKQSAMIGLLVCGLATGSVSADGEDNPGLAGRVAELELIVAELTARLEHVRVVDGDINGVAGPHFIIEGANVHVRSGAGSTGEGCFSGNANDCESRTGLGNLIVGYNEPRPLGWDPDNLCATDIASVDPERGISICTRRGGAHHLIVGQGNNFVGHAGTVLGLFNETKGSHSTVTGGRENTSNGPYSSVAGGVRNVANWSLSSVAGGWGNTANGAVSSIAGGRDNVTFADYSVVSGGQLNTASGLYSAVSGGNYNIAGGEAATVGGGNGNSAGGPWSTVSGGEANQANTFGAVVSGGRANAAQGAISAVSGGLNNVTWAESSSISGGIGKSANTAGCTVGDNGADC